MWRFQHALLEAKPGENWLRMERIFKLESGGADPGQIQVALRE